MFIFFSLFTTNNYTEKLLTCIVCNANKKILKQNNYTDSTLMG